MSKFEYSVNSGSTFSNATLFNIKLGDQIIQKDKAPLTGIAKTFAVTWDAKWELDGISDYTDIIVRQTWQVSGSNSKSSSIDTPLLGIRFTGSYDTELLTPNAQSFDFTASFFNLTGPVTQSKMFPALIWATDANFTSASYADSYYDQTGWQINNHQLLTNPAPSQSLETDPRIIFTYSKLNFAAGTDVYMKVSWSYQP